MHVGCIPGDAGVGVHGMACVQGMGGRVAPAPGVFAACWLVGPGRASVTLPRMGVCWQDVSVLIPAPVGLSQRGKLRYGASPSIAGEAESPRSLLKTSIPSAGAELSSHTQGLGAQEVGWGAGGTGPAPVGARTS